MQGALGIGANLSNWSSADFAKAKKMVAQYKTVRKIVQRGSLYRLISPRDGSEESVTETVSQDKRSAVMFAFLHSSGMLYPFPRIYLRGLQRDATYRIEARDGELSKDAPAVASGTFWMEHGVDVNLKGDFQVAAFTLKTIGK
jgi:alpha-galactosidase